MKLGVFLNRQFNSLILVVTCLATLPGIAHAALVPVESAVIADSEEPFDRRIYHYDMVLDSQGDVHIIYAKPTRNNRGDIYYVRRVGGVWHNQVLLTSNGFGPHGATYLAVDSDDRVHMCYIKKGTPESLYYRTVKDGILTAEIFVDEGGWSSRMQLDEYDYPIFLRGNRDWDDPARPSKLVLLTTTDGTTWDRSLLALPQVQQFRLADFLYANGTYHITYGDFKYVKDVWGRQESIIDGVFHDFHYATSEDGVQWSEHLIDGSGSLYEMEFWTSMVLSDGLPVIGMYKYDQYGNSYNTGSYALLAEWTGSGWEKRIITDRSRPELTEGMGIGLAVDGNGEYFTAWDFSPRNTYNDDFRGPRGNVALARSGVDNGWSSKWQVDPFSLEGKALLHIHGGKLFFLGLGDYVDSKVYFREYNTQSLHSPSSSNTPQGVNHSPVSGKTLTPILRLLLNY